MSLPRPRDGILGISPYVGGESEVEGAARTIKLSSNESAIGPSPAAVEAYRSLAGELHRYPDGASDKLRRVIAEIHGLEPERIITGNGSDEIIGTLISAYSGPGDEVLYSRHGFLMYPIAAMAAGATPVQAPERDYTASVDALLSEVGERTRMVFLANPNNPTGTYIGADELARLHAGLPSDVLLVIDAAYAEFVSANDYGDGAGLVRGAENVVMTRTFSKLHGLAGLRLGWAYVPRAVADVYHRVRGPFNVNAAAQAAGIAALLDHDHRQKARAHNDRWLPWLTREFARLGLDPIPSVGNFLSVAFGAEGPKSAAAALAFLNARAILPRAIAGYGLSGHLRFTVGLEDENRAVIQALEEFLAAPDD